MSSNKVNSFLVLYHVNSKVHQLPLFPTFLHHHYLPWRLHYSPCQQFRLSIRSSNYLWVDRETLGLSTNSSPTTLKYHDGLLRMGFCNTIRTTRHQILQLRLSRGPFLAMSPSPSDYHVTKAPSLYSMKKNPKR